MLKHETSQRITIDDEKVKKAYCPRCEKWWVTQTPEASLYAHISWAHPIEMDGHANV
jgi:hypothetical protein